MSFVSACLMSCAGVSPVQEDAGHAWIVARTARRRHAPASRGVTGFADNATGISGMIPECRIPACEGVVTPLCNTQ